MPNLSGLVTQLKKAPDRMQQQLTGLNAALAAFAGVYRKQELSLDARCQQKHAHELQLLREHAGQKSTNRMRNRATKEEYWE
jgi:hypothetical protein